MDLELKPCDQHSSISGTSHILYTATSRIFRLGKKDKGFTQNFFSYLQRPTRALLVVSVSTHNKNEPSLRIFCDADAGKNIYLYNLRKNGITQ